MKKLSTQESTARYYSQIGSRIGYALVMRRSQHFGFYDKSHTTEDAAQENYHRKFAKLLDLKPGMKVLDAGCGQGVVACYLAAYFDIHVTGVTITPHEVKDSQKRAKRLGVAGKTEFLLADYAETPLPDGSFDVIYTTETLSHAPDVAKVLREFHRLLKPGGKIVCAEYEMDHRHFDDRTKRLAELVRERAAIYGIYQFGKGEFMTKIKKVGFRRVKETDWTEGEKPSFDRLRRLARPIARLIEGTRLQARFVNVTAAGMYSDGVERGIFAYKVYTAKK